MKKTILITCLITLFVPLFTMASTIDRLEVYSFTSNTTTLSDQDSYYKSDHVRAGFRAYVQKFMFRIETHLYPGPFSLKYGYIEYSKKLNNFKIGIQWGKWLIPVMYNYPGAPIRPMTRYAYSINNLSVYGTGISTYAERGIFKVRIANFDFEKYAASVDIGPLNIWWTKNEGKGLFIKKSLHSWINLHAGLANFEDSPDAYFVQNHISLNSRMRIYMHQDFGDFHGAFIGGLNYMLLPNDKESTVGIFYDTTNKWQIKITFGINKML